MLLVDSVAGISDAEVAVNPKELMKLRSEILKAVPLFLEISLVLCNGWSLRQRLYDRRITGDDEFDPELEELPSGHPFYEWVEEQYDSWEAPKLEVAIALITIIEHCWYDIHGGEKSLYDAFPRIYDNFVVGHSTDSYEYSDESNRDARAHLGRDLLQDA